MANTTTKGIIYPTSGDNVAPLETVFATMADSVNTLMPLVGNQSFTGPINTTTPVIFSVSFPITFASAPRIIASITGTSSSPPYAVSVHSITTTGFSARVWRLTGTATTGEALNLSYTAK